VLKAQPALWSGVQQPEEGADDEERFVDVDTDSEGEGGKEEAGGGGGGGGKAKGKAAGGGGGAPPQWPREGGYDMRKR
jgi:hypothetical protein